MFLPELNLYVTNLLLISPKNSLGQEISSEKKVSFEKAAQKKEHRKRAPKNKTSSLMITIYLNIYLRQLVVRNVRL